MTNLQKNIIYTAGAALLIVGALASLGGGSGDQMGPPGGKPPAQQNKAQANPPTRPEKNNPQRSQASEATLPTIGVVNVASQSYTASVKGYGEVSPEFSLTLTARVSGQIDKLGSQFQTGKQVKAGTTLATINDADYRQALASAEALYQQALVELEEEKLQGEQARNEWARSGLEGEPTSDLVLRGPYLKAAEANVKEALAQKQSASRDLANTHISAPFNSVIVTRDVQPGSYVQAGGTVASLFSTDKAEVAIPLSASQWQNLPPIDTLAQHPWSVTLTDMDGMVTWQGQVTRVEQHLDSATRQRSAIVTITQPLSAEKPLYFGTYVVAHIAGKTWEQVWQIPSSAISQKQEVWFVSAQSTLDKVTPEVLFQDQSYAYITPIKGMEDAQIVVRPLNSYLVGTKVNVLAEGDE